MKKLPIKSNVEMASLALLLQDNSVYNQGWDASYFAIEAHRFIFEAFEGFYSRTGSCDVFNVITELEAAGRLEKVGGTDYVIDMSKVLQLPPGRVCHDVANEYRIELAQAKGYRDLITQYEDSETLIRAGEYDLLKLSETINKAVSIDTKPKKSKKEVLNSILDSMEGKVKEEVYPTGVIILDRNLKGGMHKGEMMTVAAETGGGKSILLVQAALANIEEGKKVLFLSLEMSADDIYRRMAASLSGVPIRDAEDYKTEHRWELPKLADAFAKLSKMPIEVIDGIGTIREIEAEIDKHSSYDVVCCDYIQIVSSDNNDNRENAISEVARRLKLSAMKHKMVMFTASQLNDEGKLRESRAIGMHSDQVVCIEHKGKTKLIVRKNRRGPRNATINVTMNGELSKFEPEF
jgi:replicative DNA helicase